MSCRKQEGGVAPLNFRHGAQQPSEEVMKWATTAGVPTPVAPQMRGVAHGGKRHTRRSKKHAKKHRRRTMKQRRIHKRRN